MRQGNPDNHRKYDMSLQTDKSTMTLLMVRLISAMKHNYGSMFYGGIW